MTDCPHCRASQEEAPEGTRICSACGREFAYFRFDARQRPAPASAAAIATTPCHQHRDNPSVATCSRCGSFLCSLCRTESEGRTFCPACFARLHSEGKLDSTRRELVAWGRLVMVLAVLAWFPLYGCAFGAAAIGMGIYGLARMKKESRISGKRWVYAGILLAAVGMTIWTACFGIVFWNGFEKAARRPRPAAGRGAAP